MRNIQFSKSSTATYTDFQLEYFLIIRNILCTKGLLANLTWNTSKDADYKYHLGNELRKKYNKKCSAGVSCQFSAISHFPNDQDDGISSMLVKSADDIR